ncbi:methyl-accepting chemotaxis protein [Patulibacter americanus]|uniref:methyl-accepting chemotaxis protein n=1 Tax=Patulibacter americanus TaxID=588672 RepID=UPI000419FC8C|nr:methyl-accepting chemotaxis protein [Patulibacter americanus]
MLDRLTLRAKILGLSAMLLAFLLVVGVVGIRALGSVDRVAGSMYDDRVVPLRDLGAARAVLGDIDSQVQRAIHDRDVSRVATYRAVIARDRERLEGLFSGYTATVLVPEERRQVAAFRQRWPAFNASVDGLLSAVGEGRTDAASSTYLARTAPLYATVDGELAELVRINDRVAQAADLEISDTATGSRRTAIALIVVAFAVGLAAALLVTRAIRRAAVAVIGGMAQVRDACVTPLTDALRAMADGDLTVRIDADVPVLDAAARDELGDVARATNGIRSSTLSSIDAYNASRDGLTGLVGSVTHSSQVLSAASQEMAATSEEAGRAVTEIANAVSDVAQGAERQVRSVEQARAATQEVGEATRSGADSARRTSEAATEARTVAIEGERAVAQATEAMRQVRESSREVTSAMHGLAGKSEQIGGIVEAITAIAGQTNLLALNAAIEAARAGEQGRGFAVVAEEVRKLAEESQRSAASIATLVGEIQTETAQAVAVVADGATRSEEGAATVAQARDAFTRIGASVEDMSARVESIAAVVQQIAASADRVQADMAEVAAVAEQSSASSEEVSASTEQTSASAQEIASSAQQLAATANELEELVGRFTVAR